MEISGQSQPREASIEATVIRADGTREELGVVSYYHRNPLKRLYYKLTGRVWGAD